MTYLSIQAKEEADFTIATEAEADRFDAFWGSDIPSDQAWVLSDRDVWYANPAYVGPAVPHPFEDEYADEEDGDAPVAPADYDDIPF
jgi:hypothetical protein